MEGVTTNQILSLTIGLLFFIPSYVLYKSYQTTKIRDFGLFSGLFLVSSIAALSNFLSLVFDVLFFYQLNVTMLNLTFYLLILHGMQVRFKKPPKSLFWATTGYLIFLTTMILFWKKMMQPNDAYVIFMHMPNSISTPHPHGAGLVINHVWIYSTSYYLLGLIFWIFASAFLLWVYATVELQKPTESITRARNLWITAWIIELIWCLFLLPFAPYINEINVLILINNILIVYLSLKYPESMLLSNDQIVRYQGLYNRIMAMSVEDTDEFGMDSLVDYLKTLPKGMNRERSQE